MKTVVPYCTRSPARDNIEIRKRTQQSFLGTVEFGTWRRRLYNIEHIDVQRRVLFG